MTTTVGRKITRDTIKFISGLGPDGETAAAEIYRRAFDLVANPADWKAPVEKTIHVDELEYDPEVIADAVEFMTATTCFVHRNEKWITFSAMGYRRGPAGP